MKILRSNRRGRKKERQISIMGRNPCKYDWLVCKNGWKEEEKCT